MGHMGTCWGHGDLLGTCLGNGETCWGRKEPHWGHAGDMGTQRNMSGDTLGRLGWVGGGLGTRWGHHKGPLWEELGTWWGHAGDVGDQWAVSQYPAGEVTQTGDTLGTGEGFGDRLGTRWHLSQRLAQEVMRQRGRAEVAEEALGGLARAATRYWEGTGRNWRSRGHWGGLGGIWALRGMGGEQGRNWGGTGRMLGRHWEGLRDLI